MEVIKKTIQQVLITGITATTGGSKYIIIPDLSVVYHMKIGLVSVVKDIGFFDVGIGYNTGYYGYGYYGESGSLFTQNYPIGLENLL